MHKNICLIRSHADTQTRVRQGGQPASIHVYMYTLQRISVALGISQRSEVSETLMQYKQLFVVVNCCSRSMSTSGAEYGYTLCQVTASRPGFIEEVTGMNMDCLEQQAPLKCFADTAGTSGTPRK